MHGPNQGTKAVGAFAPHWPDPIPVLDTVALGIKRHPVQRSAWRRSRDMALARWAASGLRFAVMEDKPGKYVPASVPWDYCIVPGKLRLLKGYVIAPGEPGDFASYRDLVEGAIVWLTFWGKWWKQPASLAATITHEIGHCLGLGHRLSPNDVLYKAHPTDFYDGSPLEGGVSYFHGVMAGGDSPDAHDLASLADYYLGAP